jgi:hypothetical protein
MMQQNISKTAWISKMFNMFNSLSTAVYKDEGNSL